MTPLAQDLGGVVLLPCPFCGGRGEVGGLIPWVECQSCGASGPQAETEAAAIAAWNRRTHSAEIAGALRDAERYRWLREHFRFANDSMHEIWFDDTLEPDDSGVPTDLDQTIDTAMQQGG